MGAVRQRLFLVPQILKEVFTHPVEDSTLVKRGDEVIVARKGVDLQDKVLDGLVLRNVDLRNANLQGADLSGTNFVDSNLCGADLSGAIITDTTDFRGADLRGVTADPGILAQAKLEGARRGDDIVETS